MIGDVERIQALHQKYANDNQSFELVFTHCKIVAEIAIDTVRRNNLKVDERILTEACLLHDIGAYTLWMPKLQTFKDDGYQQHALIGASILQDEGYSSAVVSAVRTHVLMGLSAKEIAQQNWRLPYIDVEPQTIEGRLLCFADRFHSKHPRFNDPKVFINGLSKDFPCQAKLFQGMIEEYGLPDIRGLAKRYGHTIT